MGKCLVGYDLWFAHGETWALRGAHVAVGAGTVTALVGPSGCGKTTLLWLLAGLLVPQRGRVVLHDTSQPGPGAGVDLSRCRPRRGMVFQQPALWDHLTVADHLRLVVPRALPAGPSRADRVEAVLDQVGLAPYRRRFPAQLSGGQQQRLALARALVVEPQWLFLDEPLAHLDGPARGELLMLLRGVLERRAAGVVLATHEPSEALRLADRIVVLLDGQVAQAGSATEVYHRPARLAVALALGPASELRGQAGSGVLRDDRGQPLLTGLPPMLAGPQRLILRPHEIALLADPAGPARVEHCELVGPGYQLVIGVGDQVVTAMTDQPVAIETAGRLVATCAKGPGRPEASPEVQPPTEPT